MVHGHTHGETQGSTIPFVPRLPSHPLHTMQTRFPLKTQKQREAGEQGAVYVPVHSLSHNVSPGGAGEGSPP